MKIKAGIIGAAGYTGGETIRLLLNHPHVIIHFAHSTSSAGKSISSIHQDLIGETDLFFTNQILPDADVLFLCLGHGDSATFLIENQIPETTKIIDLSQDFRLQETNRIGSKKFVYGLPELNKQKIQEATCIANPGCFATAIQLGLLPIAKMGQLGDIHSTGITGSTGAGQGFSGTSHFSWRTNNIQAYKTLTHQHLHEIGESLFQLSGNKTPIHFIPWRGDFARGIHISSIIDSNLTLDESYTLYESFYADAPFTHVSKNPIDLKQVVNTNKCLIHLEKVNQKLVIHSVIDNLLKGASGQAIQNMNLLLGLDETAGLKLKATAF